MPLLRRLFGPPREKVPTVVEEAPAPVEGVPTPVEEPDMRSILVMARSADSFYHNLTDEEFCTWARGWSSSPQVLTHDDREVIINRLRSGNTVLGTDQAP